jgi:hypothetical protein
LGQEIAASATSVLEAVVPLAVLFVAFQLLLLRLPRAQFVGILTGTCLASAGLFLFLLGVSIGFVPFGRAIGEALGSFPRAWLFPLGLVLGFVTTWGEPAVRILANEVEDASSGSLRAPIVLVAICSGVALWVGLGMLRIGYGIPLAWLIVPAYALAIAMMWFSENRFVSVAVDAGGVATGPLANTFLLSLALGASAAMGDQDPVVSGLGLVALIAVAPVISVMLLGYLYRSQERRTGGSR